MVYANAKLKSGVKAPTGNFADVTWFDETIENGSNYRALESALKLIDSRDANIGFCGVLAAVIEDGVATTIIINDTYGEYVDQGGEKPAPDLTGKVTVTMREGNNTIRTVEVEAKEGATKMPTPFAGDGYIPTTAEITIMTDANGNRYATATYTLVEKAVATGDHGEASSPALDEAITDAAEATPNTSKKPSENPTRPSTGITPITTEDGKDKGQKLIGDDVKNALESAVKALSAGIHHYPASLQELIGWTTIADQSIPLQIGKDQDPDTAVILVTIPLTSNSGGYKLLLDGELVAEELWKSTTGIKYLNWDEIPVGEHVFQLVKVGATADDDEVVQWGQFTMTKTNAR